MIGVGKMKRKRKPSKKALEQEYNNSEVMNSKKYSGCKHKLVNIVIVLLVWCTIKLESPVGSNREYSVHSRFLQTETGEKVTEKDLFFGNSVIWMSKGKPYEVTVLETHR